MTELSKEVSYLVGSATLKAYDLKSEISNGLNTGADVCGFLEEMRSLGATSFGIVQDLSQGDPLCTGLCTVATLCETVVVSTTTPWLKKLPYRRRVYVACKGSSMCVMKFRNLCKNAQGKIGPC